MPVLSSGHQGASGPLLVARTPASTLRTILAIRPEDERPHASTHLSQERPGPGREPCRAAKLTPDDCAHTSEPTAQLRAVSGCCFKRLRFCFVVVDPQLRILSH